MEIEKVFTPDAPEPVGHYSQAVIANEMIFISGQLPIVPGSGEKISGTIEDQTLQVLKNIEAIRVNADIKKGMLNITHK
jgi:2-iminobutanoate/2-iminopropanoate deaminase